MWWVVGSGLAALNRPTVTLAMWWVVGSGLRLEPTYGSEVGRLKRAPKEVTLGGAPKEVTLGGAPKEVLLGESGADNKPVTARWASPVIPAKAGIQNTLGPGFCRDDDSRSGKCHAYGNPDG